MLIDRYQEAVDKLLAKVRNTQRNNILEAGQLVADAVANGNNIYLMNIVHGIDMDVIYRGGGPIFYKKLNELGSETDARKRELSAEEQALIEEGNAPQVPFLKSNLRPGDVVFVSSVSGRTESVVNFTYQAVKYGLKVIAFTSMEYARQVEPVHPSGKKLYEMATLVLDNCAPAAEAMLQVDGIEAPFAASSGIASDYILWSLTSVAVEKLLEKGITPGILKSANFPGGNDYNKQLIEPHYAEFGW